MKSSQKRKPREVEAEQDAPESEQPVFFLGKEITIRHVAKPPADAEIKDKTKEIKIRHVAKPPADAEIKDRTTSADEPVAGAEDAERWPRPSQLEAYMRYAKMREPHDSEESLAAVGPRRYSNKDNFAGNENEQDWSGSAARRRQRHNAPSLRLRDAMLAGAASIAVGALGGAVVYDRAHDGVLSSAAFDAIGGFVTGLNAQASNAGDAKAASASTQDEQQAAAATKKPIATARLDVTDAQGTVNTLIPLKISAEPAVPNQDIALRLSGLPADAYLTAGTKLADNAWILKPGEEMDVKLMVPSAQPSPLLIAVDAIEPRTGDLAAPTEEIKVALGSAGTTTVGPEVLPASAPPSDVKRNFNLPPAEEHEAAAAVAAQPIPTPTKEQEAAAAQIPAPAEKADGQGVADSASLMRNGDKLLELGDLSAARTFFSKARDLGNREASLRLGKTYDPVVFSDKNVQGLKPDPAMALKYYLEARTAGIADAENAITGLETWMKK